MNKSQHTHTVHTYLHTHTAKKTLGQKHLPSRLHIYGAIEEVCNLLKLIQEIHIEVHM